MITYTSTDRPLVLTTAQGVDGMLVAGFQGHEGISELFHFRLDLRMPRQTPVPFAKLLGEQATLTYRLPGGGERHFSGILSRIVQDDQDEHFTWCQADLVPHFWLWTQRQQSRIFQQQSVPDILRTVFRGLDVNYKLTERYEPREYCVQYRETDFAFASRLMEDEGIYYFFTHSADGDALVVTDHGSMLPAVPGPKSFIYDRAGSRPDESRVRAWSKAQSIRPGKYLLWELRDKLGTFPTQLLRRNGRSLIAQGLPFFQKFMDLRRGHPAPKVVCLI